LVYLSDQIFACEGVQCVFRLFVKNTIICVFMVLIMPLAGASVKPRIAIIIDDLGNQRIAGERVIALPGPIACSIMPHTAHSRYLAERANAAGKEVMLHLPMQAVEMGLSPGPGGIDIDTSRTRFGDILAEDLENVPYTRGVNNHMGSLITRHPGHMNWLMDELLERGNLFFIDSYTTASSIALQIALDKGVPAARRNVFLDTPESALDIAGEFERLKREAVKNGFAIGIGHPYPDTIEFLEQALPQLIEQGFELVPVSELVTPDANSRLAEAS
jgi:polysaccharide deacetylase 2 family uncharacterized protein YibQ